MHPLSLPLDQQPVKHPQLNREALPNTLRMPENPYIHVSKGRWAGTQDQDHSTAGAHTPGPQPLWLSLQPQRTW